MHARRHDRSDQWKIRPELGLRPNAISYLIGFRSKHVAEQIIRRGGAALGGHDSCLSIEKEERPARGPRPLGSAKPDFAAPDVTTGKVLGRVRGRAPAGARLDGKIPLTRLNLFEGCRRLKFKAVEVEVMGTAEAAGPGDTNAAPMGRW
jgi:hypothetical protein